MTIRKNKALTITFAAIDPAARPARKTGVSFSAGETKVSLDGGTFNNTGSNPAEIGSTGRYSLALTAAEMDADNIHISIENASMDPVDYTMMTSGDPTGKIVADGSNTALTFKTDLTEATNDYWKDLLIVFTSGSLVDQVKRIATYNGTSKFITVYSGFTGTPSGDDRFILVNR